LRILDSKDPRDKAICAEAPSVDDYLTSEAADFFAAVVAGIDAAGVPWKRNAKLVRGLDYYRHTAFEFVTDRLGSQGAVIAGGRYDGLIESLGGPHTPAIGWAAGIERLAMMIDAPEREKPVIAVIPDSPSMQAAAQKAVALLRRAGLASSMAFRGNSKKRNEVASREDVMIKLFIREEGDPRGALHVTYYNTSFSNAEQEDATTRIQEALGEHFGWVIGSEGWNRR
jgi:histidyl-tRNA synthetase